MAPVARPNLTALLRSAEALGAAELRHQILAMIRQADSAMSPAHPARPILYELKLAIMDGLSPEAFVMKLRAEHDLSWLLGPGEADPPWMSKLKGG